MTNKMSPEEIAEMSEDCQCSCKELDRMRTLCEVAYGIWSRNQGPESEAADRMADILNEILQGSPHAHEPCEQRCPHDGGKCHHGCADECFRATGGGSLSNPWPGFPVACTHPIKGAMPDIGEAIAMKADEGRQCTCAKDNHGVDCAWNGCCGQCSGMRT